MAPIVEEQRNPSVYWQLKLRIHGFSRPSAWDNHSGRRGPAWDLHPLVAIRRQLDEIYQTRLGFNVKVAFTWLVENDGGNLEKYHMQLSPWVETTTPGQHNAFSTFMKNVGAHLSRRFEALRGIQSNIRFKGLSEIRVSFAPGAALRRFGRVVPQAGGNYQELPDYIKHKHAVVNIQTPKDDHCCFQCSVVCGVLQMNEDTTSPAGKNAHRFAYYQVWSRPHTTGRRRATDTYTLKDAGLDFSMCDRSKPFQICDVDIFEQKNPSVGVFVYTFVETQVENTFHADLVQLRRPERKAYAHEVKLLLHEDHYCLITSWQALNRFRNDGIVDDRRSSGNTRYRCHWCMHQCSSAESLQAHLAKGVCSDGEVFNYSLPKDTDKSGHKSCIRYHVGKEVVKHPLVIYADLEVFSTPNGDQMEQSKVASYGYHAVAQGFHPGKDHLAKVKRCKGDEDILVDFLFDLVRLANTYYDAAEAKRDVIDMTAEDKANHAKARKCGYCDRAFSKSLRKVRDHDHFTGRYRTASCDQCNGAVQVPRTGIPVVFHNLSGYDCHFILKALAKARAEYGDAPAYERKGKDPIKVEDMRFKVFSKSSERCLSIQWGCFRFIDSMSFLAESMGTLIQNQGDAFPILRAHHPWGSVLKKLPMPFDHMRGPDIWNAPPVLSRGCYDGLTDAEWEDLNATARRLEFKTFGDMHDCYLHTDVLALADCMESFRDTFFEMHKIDALHFMSLPAASMKAMLKSTRASIELVTESNGGREFLDDINNNIRGGLAHCFQPYSCANLPEEPNYEPSSPRRQIMYMDANSLYPSMMCKKLPVGDYSEVPLSADPIGQVLRLAGSYTALSNVGYMAVVDYEIPDALHDRLQWAPVMKMKVEHGDLSPYTQGLDDSHVGSTKLVPYLGPHQNEGLHIELLKVYLELGVVVKKVHRLWSFAQTDFCAEWIRRLASDRAKAATAGDAVAARTHKLTGTSLYGKFLQRVHQTDITLHLDVTKFLNGVNDYRCVDWDIIDNGSAFMGTVTKKREGVPVTTARPVGWAILELAKAHMYRAWYHGVAQVWPRARLLMTDTDSLVFEVEDDEPCRRLRQANADGKLYVQFDLRGVKANDGRYNHALGALKIEAECVLEYQGIAAKLARLRTPGEDIIKSRGIPARALPQPSAFDDALHDPMGQPALKYRRIVSRGHSVTVEETQHRGLACINDKVWQLSFDRSRPLGHWRNRV